MTLTNPHPLANPFNDRPYGNYRPGYGNPISHQRSINRNDLTVPNQDIPYNGSPEWNSLHTGGPETPNQDIPLGDRLNNSGNSGFLNDRLFRLPDGTVIDFKTGRILKSGEQLNNGYRDISPSDAGFVEAGAWNSNSGPSLDELIRNTDQWIGTAVPGGIIEPCDPKSVAYWLRAEEEAEKLKAGMTDEQKKLIADFELHFPKSKLIEESLKQNI